MRKVTVRAGSNIAFIKYWGVADPAINVPLNSSISMTLADAHTTTTVEFDPALAADQIDLDGKRLDVDAARRLVAHLDRIRNLARADTCARIVSRNNFPMASGIASSASGFAALTVAACLALELDVSPSELSALARLGSGSAARSIFGGFVEWERGRDHESSVARQLHPAGHWNLIDLVAIVSAAAKHISSAGGHRLAATSPLNSGRVASAQSLLDPVRDAIARRDLNALGPLLELDALAMHAVMMTSTPSLVYWLPETLAVIQAVRRWRETDGIPAYFTIDAGPNVHVLCEAAHAAEIEARLRTLPGVERVLLSGPGPAPQERTDHLI